MVVLDAVPKDIHFILDVSMADMKDLKIILDNMVFNYNGDLEEHRKAKVFLEQVFYPTVEQSIESMKDGN